MSGHMGNQNATVLNQRVVKIDTDRALLYIEGNVPGGYDALVKVRDAVKKTDKQAFSLFYPTFVPGYSPEEFGAKLQVYPGAPEDP